MTRHVLRAPTRVRAQVAAAFAAGGGWILSSDLVIIAPRDRFLTARNNPQDSAATDEVNALIDMNRLRESDPSDEVFQPKIAHAASLQCWIQDKQAQAAAADEAFQRMVDANPGATVIGEALATASDDAEEAFARMVAAHPEAVVICGPGESSAAADEAFEAMVAANPGIPVLGGPGSNASNSSAAADEAFERMKAAYPDATVVGNTAEVRVLGPGSQGGGAVGGMSGWRFSSSLSAEKRADLEGLIALNGLQAGDVRDDDPATRAAADEAFQMMVQQHAGAKEVSPGVFVVE